MTDADLRTDREELTTSTECSRARPPCSVAGYQALPAHHAKKDRLQLQRLHDELVYYGYHNPNQISVAQDWQNAVSLHSYTSFPVVSSEG